MGGGGGDGGCSTDKVVSSLLRLASNKEHKKNPFKLHELNICRYMYFFFARAGHSLPCVFILVRCGVDSTPLPPQIQADPKQDGIVYITRGNANDCQ